MRNSSPTAPSRKPLDDVADADVADAAFAARHLADHFDRGAFAVRRNSRLAWGLAVLHLAGIVSLRVYRDIAGGILRNDLITVDVRLKEAA
jgi:hypothetical protein